MDYPFAPGNLVCRLIGHRWRYYRASGKTGPFRRTCQLDGLTDPPFRKVAQVPPYDYLPDDQQPEGAI